MKSGETMATASNEEILKTFDEMALRIHDDRGHQCHNIGLCEDVGCKKRLAMRFDLERRLRGEGKRNLNFRGSGPLAVALGINPDRIAKLDVEVGELVKSGASLKTVIKHFNERGDMSDAEWTSFMYAMGHQVARLETNKQMAEALTEGNRIITPGGSQS
jgi:hypothetical protein